MKFLISLILLCTAFVLPQRLLDLGQSGEDMFENGSVDDANARIQYEFDRLRDPHTNTIPLGIFDREREFVKRLTQLEDNQFIFSNAASDDRLQLDPNLTDQHGITRTGGRTRSIAFDIDDESIMLAGAVEGGVWRSTNGGKNWIPTVSGDQARSVTCLTQDARPNHHHEWYFGSGELFSTAGYPLYQVDIGNGIYKSDDNGQSWHRLTSTAVQAQAIPESPFHFVTNLAVDPSRSDSSIVYAAGNGAILRSNDGGENWSVVLGLSSGITTPTWTDVIVTPKGVVYASLAAGGNSGVWRSVNGLTWVNLSSGSSFGSVSSRVRLAYAPSNPNVIWVYRTGSATPLWKYTYRSAQGTGAGGTWENRSTYVYNGSTGLNLLATQQGYSMSLNVHPTNENIVLTGGTSLYLSQDGFATPAGITHVGGYSKDYLKAQTWDPIFPEKYLYEKSHPDLHNAIFLPSNPDVVYMACDGGVFRTENIKDTLVRWESRNEGYKAGQFYSVGIDPVGKEDGVFIGGAQDNNSSVGTSDGRPMRWVLGGDGMICDMARNHRAFYPSYQTGSVYKVAMNSTLDSVIKWVNIKPKSNNFDFIAPLVVDPVHDSILYMLGGTTIWRNSNTDGIAYSNNVTPLYQNWKSISMSSSTSSALSAIAVCSVPYNRLYVGTKNGSVYRIDSINTVPVIKAIPLPDAPLNAYVNNITVDPTDGNSVYVVFSNYGILSVYHSPDAGTNWECISGNLEENPDGTGYGPSCRWIEVLHYQGQTLYLLATSVGLFTTNTLNGMNTKWSWFRHIPTVPMNMVKARSTDGFVAIASHGLGIFTSYAVIGPGSGIIANVAEETTDNTHLRCWPQPAAEHMNVSFELQSDANVTISIIDATGRSVAECLHEVRSQGHHDLPVDLSQLSAGSYNLVLRSDRNKRASTVPFVHLGSSHR